MIELKGANVDRLSGLMAFVRAAELGSFVAAGRALGLSASAVGKGITRLEQQLSVRLFQRSTRSLRLTDEGKEFLERCRRILDDLDDAQATISRSTEKPRGRLRVSTPTVTYHLLLPILPEFLSRFPDIDLDIDFNDNMVDLIDMGVDVAIRSGPLSDSRFMSRPLRSVQMLICAAPVYLEAHGIPECIEDLSRHTAIRFRFPTSGKLQELPLSLTPGKPEPHPETVFTCNNMEALRGATIAGLGIGCMPDFLAREPLASGTLRALLNDSIRRPNPLSLVWPSSRHLSPKVRVFVDYVGKALAAVDV
ncbi:LysR substrate-binding domain-containing protein [Pseudomonas sp. NFR16]|uniref:LysR substrate-binding domain-containing protein n=1 Tax=Pseudomonas sp. NFR16 TaxID=1566248 RepID=UPI0008C589A1|nr:LysR substrate-binding domain-containing protein [Pseudomonas sp. NFR16]SEJ95136.1 DNA-binding transcriptional regulator, LysR family [Pseudomonas sp. NFR16]